MYNVILERAKAKIIDEPKHNIRILRGVNKLKLPVARVISDWLSAEDRTWTFNGSVDSNSDRIAKFLKSKFPDFGWLVMSSQTSFDIVSLDAGIAVEIKSAKKGTTTVLGNASIYPDIVTAGDVIPKSTAEEHNISRADLEKELDVLVACVTRTEDFKIYNYAIVDGSFWNVTQEDYIGCKEMFANMNEEDFFNTFLEFYLERHGKNSFVEKVLSSAYANRIKLNIRKLISLKSPVNEINICNWFD